MNYDNSHTLNSPLAVEATGLVKAFGDNRAVDGIDLQVRRGEILGVLGPNGAGKTTMLKMLSTLMSIDAGHAEIFGVDVQREPHVVRSLIGVTGQDATVDATLTATENLKLFARLQGVPRSEINVRVPQLLEQFGLEDAADRQLGQFSGGMRRRLDLASSLLTKPPLIFLDEPTTGLDPRTRGQMWQTIRDLVDGGRTVLLTTQYLDEADQLADRIVVIDHGRKVAEGTPEQLKASVGTSTLHLTLSDPTDTSQAVDVLSRVLGAEPALSPEQGRLHVPMSDANHVGDALIALRERAISVASLSVQQPTLDEVFLALTGHPAEEADTDGSTEATDVNTTRLPELETTS